MDSEHLAPGTSPQERTTSTTDYFRIWALASTLSAPMRASLRSLPSPSRPHGASCTVSKMGWHLKSVFWSGFLLGPEKMSLKCPTHANPHTLEHARDCISNQYSGKSHVSGRCCVTCCREATEKGFVVVCSTVLVRGSDRR